MTPPRDTQPYASHDDFAIAILKQEIDSLKFTVNGDGNRDNPGLVRRLDSIESYVESKKKSDELIRKAVITATVTSGLTLLLVIVKFLIKAGAL